MQIEARAKINWTLDIVGQREDGYHLMDMLMQPVTLCDIITLELADTISLRVSGAPEIVADSSNLAWRAAVALQAATGCTKGAAIHVEKRIPSQAGLGGGSADAAGVLAGLNKLWETDCTQEELERIGLTLGADVPFCLRGGFCRVRGIGEKLEPLGETMARTLLIVQPCAGLSTGAVFRAYHAAENIRHPETDQAIDLLERGGKLNNSDLGNVMQDVSIGMQPGIRDAIDTLLKYGADCAQMSGSGSAVFAVFTDHAAADRCAEEWTAGKAFVCESCSQSIVIHL